MPIYKQLQTPVHLKTLKGHKAPVHALAVWPTFAPPFQSSSSPEQFSFSSSGAGGEKSNRLKSTPSFHMAASGGEDGTVGLA